MPMDAVGYDLNLDELGRGGGGDGGERMQDR